MQLDFLETSVRYNYVFKAGVVLPRSQPPAVSAGSSSSKSVPSSSSKAPAAKQAPAATPAGAVSVLHSGGDKFGKNQKDLQDLCKRRFFYRQAFDIYGGVAGFFTYGPPGAAMKNNLIRQWRQHFVIEDNLLEVEDTCIMQHCVLKASGHVDRFNDFMVKDKGDESRFFRADKLLEDIMEEKLKADGLTAEQKKEYTVVKNMADSYSRQEMTDLFIKYQIKAPETGNDLSDPYEFNLMFPTPIGPGGYLQGYLRPETAQGIFLNYKSCCEQNANRLPFGVAQVGKSFRNEIAPRAGLTRQREFTQAEIEYFVNPKVSDHPKFASIAPVTITFFHANEQLAGQEPFRMTMGDAYAKGVLKSQIVAYMIVRTHLFLVNSGVAVEHVRFRQHLPTEMAHYASDCWDCEVFCSLGWLECVGIADRSAFDLNAHSKAAKVDLQYRQTLDKPIEQEVLVLQKASGVAVMKHFKKDGRMVKEWIDQLPQVELEELAALKGPKTVEIEGKSFDLTPELLKFDRKQEKISVNSFTPGVIEPSFGIDRIFTVILEHVYYVRPKDEKDTGDDKNVRAVLGLPACTAPYKCAILPLDQRVARNEKYESDISAFRSELSSLGLSTTSDESGAAIGRRYARNDELGVPFAITFDFTSLEDRTVTMRERDTMTQIRLPLDDAAVLLRDMCALELTWEEVAKKYPKA